MGIDIKVVATTASILSKETLVICLLDCSFKLESLMPKLTSAIDVSGLGSHSEPADEGTLDKLMWVESEDLSIFTGTWLRFIGVDDEIRGSISDKKKSGLIYGSNCVVSSNK